jgi:hypothetical protein
MGVVVVGNLSISERFKQEQGTPVLDQPTRKLYRWSGRVTVSFASNQLYDADTGLPLATLSGSAITAGPLFSMGARRLSEVVSIVVQDSKLHGGTTYTAAGGNTALPVSVDYALASVRVFQPDVDIAGTPDNLTELADNGDLATGATLPSATSAFMDMIVEFWAPA